MKTVVTLALIALVAAIGMGVVSIICHIKASVMMANLQLADDASTPEQKAQFLRKFVADMDVAGLPTHAAWVYKSERNKLANQRVVLESLIKRCDDTAGLNKESMGYSQGMTQITGQEFDHAIGQISALYEKGYAMRYGWFALHGWWVLLILFGIGGATLMFINDH